MSAPSGCSLLVVGYEVIAHEEKQGAIPRLSCRNSSTMSVIDIPLHAYRICCCIYEQFRSLLYSLRFVRWHILAFYVLVMQGCVRICAAIKAINMANTTHMAIQRH